MTGSIYDWSTTASANGNSDGDINFAEGQAPSTLNNSNRQVMGRVAELIDDLGSNVTVGGTANAITIAANSAISVYATGQRLVFKAGSSNTGTTTLNVNSIGAKAVRKIGPTGDADLASGELQAGSLYEVIYSADINSGAGGWQLMNLPAYGLPSKLTDINALTPTDSNIIVGNGTTWVAESGAVARASLGAQATIGYTPADATVTVTGAGLATGGGSLAANRVLTVTAATKAQAEAGTATTVAVTPLGVSQAMDARPYSGSDGSNTDFPIGSYVIAAAGSERNQAATIRLDATNPARYTALSGAGSALTGTWRARGTFLQDGGIGHTLFQRVA